MRRFKLNLVKRLKYISKKGDPKEVGGMLYSFASVAIAILTLLMLGIILTILILHLKNGVVIQQFEVLGFIILLILALLLSLGKAETIGDRNV